jgi:hypothetical protein
MEACVTQERLLLLLVLLLVLLLKTQKTAQDLSPTKHCCS